VRIAVTGQVLDGTGYGEYARLVAWAIHESGHNLRVRNRPTAPERPERLGHKGALMCARLGHEVEEPLDLALAVYVPTSFRFLTVDDTVNVGLGMHESDLVPTDYTRVSNRSVDVLAVPSQWNRWTFKASGLQVPTAVIHPPVDSDLLRMRVRDRSSTVTFLSIFAWPAPHKNPKSLIEAFCRAFTSSDPVRLVIKTVGVSDERISNDVHEAMRLSGVARAPEIKVLCGSMTRSELLDLYSSSDVYVSSHRGEGWGLPIFESMAIGMPAIATAFSAPLEFMHAGNSYLVDYAYDKELGNAEVDVDDLARKMRRAFKRPHEARAIGERARTELGMRFTAQHTAAQVIESAYLARTESC
jgi:glycosyltransferase involved in cell wall biosynthesis